MAEDMTRRTQLRDALCDKVGTEVADMLVDYMPSAGWTDLIDRRFEQVDRRFVEIDRRFEQIDQRFEAIDRRFDEVNRRFEQLERRVDHIEARLDTLGAEIVGLRESLHTWSRWMMGTVLASWISAVGCVAAVVLTR